MLMTRPRRNNAQGFTLIELMVVVAIIGVGTALALPNMSETIRAANARSETRTVLDVITRARNLARLSLCEIRVAVTATSIVVGPNPSDALASCKAIKPTTYPFTASRVILTPFVAKTVTKNPFIFNKSGGTDYAGIGRLTVKNKVTNEFTYIDVYSAIGTVTESK
jgi:prepilin-type N-terminal cleavage/methylation domain-containing protein